MRTSTVEPLVGAPAADFLDSLAGLPTPSLAYDLDGLRRSVDLLAGDVGGVAVAELNLALKACHTPRVLSFLAGLGIGADVASSGELELAVDAGFPRITATGPSFTAADLATLDGRGVVLDASSIEQLREVCLARPGRDVGLRLRVPLPGSIEDGRTTFGSGSRFGVMANDPRIAEVLTGTGSRLTRLHTHTGQMTPLHLRYKLRYLLAVAEAWPDVAEIDLGGGFFSLYADREQALAAWAEVAEALAGFTARTGRTVKIQVEPGGAILAPHGYLVTAVRATEVAHPHFDADVVTVDTSAWNLAPWHKPQAVPLTPAREGERLRPTLIAGNTLYENDFFGTDVLGKRPTYPLPELRAGDRLLLTNSGAYTMTNSRLFNRLPPPAEYVVQAGTVERIS
jgi:diaminopimelate decarboxylase